MAAGGVDSSIPMSAQLNVPNIPMAMARGMDLKQKQIETKNIVRDDAEADSDRQALTDYQSSGGDLYTLEGIAKAKDDLKGKVSFGTYAKVNQQAETLKQHDLDIKQRLQTLDTASIANIVKKNDIVSSALLPLVTDGYQEKLKASGKIDADDWFMKQKAAALQQLSQLKDAEGKPMFSPEEMQAKMAAGLEQTLGALRGGAPYQALAKNKLVEAQTKAAEAQADLRGSQADKVDAQTKQVQEALKNAPYGDKMGFSQLKFALKEGDITPEEYAAGLKNIIAKAGGTASNRPVATPLTPEGQAVMDKMFKDGTITAASLRGASSNPVLTDTLNRLGAQNADPSSDRAAYQTNVTSLRKLVPMYDAVKSFEDNTIAQGKILKGLAQKVDATGVPVVERWIRAGRKAIEGDEDVSEFQAQLSLFSSESAKILTNPNLTGTLSDTARAEVQEFLPKSATAGQISRVVDRLESDFQLREKSLEDQIGTINKRIKGQTSVGGTPKAQTDNKVAPATQKERDGDVLRVLQDERKAQLEKIAKAVNTPENKAKDRAESDLREIDKEIANAAKTGGKVKPTDKDREVGKRNPALAKAFKEHFGVDP